MDAAQFEDLYRHHWQAVFGYARRRTDTAADAADVVADVFTVAWRRRADVPDGAQAKLWLFGVARNCLANSARGQQRRGRLHVRLTEAVHELAPDPADRVIGADGITTITAALESLPASDRELLMLVGWEELSPADAAEVLGIAPALVRVRLRRARIRLRRLLDSDEQRNQVTGHVQRNGQTPVTAGEAR